MCRARVRRARRGSSCSYRVYRLGLTAQIGIEHGPVGAYLVGTTMRKQFSLHKNSERVGDREHGIHVVPYQDDRMVADQIAQQGYDALGLFRSHTGERLVQNPEIRAAGD